MCWRSEEAWAGTLGIRPSQRGEIGAQRARSLIKGDEVIGSLGVSEEEEVDWASQGTVGQRHSRSLTMAKSVLGCPRKLV